jgi:hypothetical protein
MDVDWNTVGGVGRGLSDTDSDNDWGNHLRTTGSGSHTTLDLTHVRNYLGHMSYYIGPHLFLSDNKNKH